VAARRDNGAVSAVGRAWLLALALLAGCASLDGRYESRVHVVRPGDTLYKIAFQYGLEQTALARWNNISNPDLIYVGQRIRLSPPYPQPRASASQAPGRTAAARPATGTRESDARAPAPRNAPAARNAPAPARAEPPPPNDPPPAWVWPTEGPIVAPFGSREGIPTGVGIGGAPGQPVRAAAAGRVVYAGSGLIGYGQLIIIKHNETYLSAYGHNSQIWVTEGQDVARGETIATMGLGPERRPRLHFEIRRNGVPVDPTLLVSAGR
jgi:lipoprotein NlpD